MIDSNPMTDFSKLLWVTNNPKTIKSLWPRRSGVEYLQGPPKATFKYTAEELAKTGLVGVYVDMPEASYRALPVVRTPEELAKRKAGVSSLRPSA